MEPLRAAELRVLGCLIEKEITTPEYYPLSLNALVNACNQKSSRDPVMEMTEAEVRSALFDLEALDVVRVLAEGRVSKFEHRAYDKLQLRRPEIALLGLLLLRGPQTAAELRGRSERMYSFDDVGNVTEALERMSSRDQPLVLLLARQPGAREGRWAQLLSGEAATEQEPVQAGNSPQSLTERVLRLEQQVEALGGRLAELEEERAGAIEAQQAPGSAG